MRSIIKRCFATTAEGQFQTSFGPLINIKPHPGDKHGIEGIEILKDESVGRIMHLIEKQNKCYIFDNNARYDDTVKFHNKLKNRFLQKFAGTKKHPKQLYGRSQRPGDIFHHLRMIQCEVDKGMCRIGYHMFKDGTLDLSGKIPECNILPELIEDWKMKIPDELFGTSYAKPDYFISVPLYHEACYASDLEKGTEYTLMTGERLSLKGSYGVIMPFHEHMRQLDSVMTEIFESDKSVLDIETNTGALSTYISYKGALKVHKYDTNKYAHKALKLDIEELKLNKRENQEIKEIKSEVKENYDIIICMPPLLHCSNIKSDTEFANIHYDPNGKLLKRCFSSARNIL